MIFLAYARQQWSRERDLLWRFRYVACRRSEYQTQSCVIKWGIPISAFGRRF